MKRNHHLMTGLMLILALASAVSAAEDTLKTKIDSIFVVASSGEFKYQKLVGPAEDSIAAMKTAAVPYLIDRLGTTEARERVALENIFRKIGQPAVPFLNQALLTTDSLQLSRVALIIGNLPDTSSVPNLLQVTSNSFYWVRYESIRALGFIKDLRAVPAVQAAMADTNELVRTIAAVSAGHLLDTSLIPALIRALDDNYYGVRMAAKDELAKLPCGRKTIDLLSDQALAGSPLRITYLLSILADDSCVCPLAKIAPYFEHADPLVQSLAFRIAARADKKAVAQYLSAKARGDQTLIMRQTIDDLTGDNETTTTSHP
ncbi:MAG: HEAT repeat domain-containing protein [candidate division Zixibacteria bacterium]|nr:HEAT repeat domain-containing protein [candidate division Zixibacteria bacterium]